MLKNTQRYFYGMHGMSYRGCKEEEKEKGQILHSTGRDVQIVSSAKLLDITYEPYGFNADLIEAIN